MNTRRCPLCETPITPQTRFCPRCHTATPPTGAPWLLWAGWGLIVLVVLPLLICGTVWLMHLLGI